MNSGWWDQAHLGSLWGVEPAKDPLCPSPHLSLFLSQNQKTSSCKNMDLNWILNARIKTQKKTELVFFQTKNKKREKCFIIIAYPWPVQLSILLYLR